MIQSKLYSVGLHVAGKILVNAGFVTLDLHFTLEKEPKLNLNTDVDFSSENLLCMQLSQPDDVLRYAIIEMNFENIFLISNISIFLQVRIGKESNYSGNTTSCEVTEEVQTQYLRIYSLFK